MIFKIIVLSLWYWIGIISSYSEKLNDWAFQYHFFQSYNSNTVVMIYRAEKKVKFTVVDNEFILDKKLSAKSKGILIYLLSLPDKWAVYKTELERHFKDGKQSIYTGFNELIETGYIVKVDEIKRNEKGQFKTMAHYIIYELSIYSERFKEFYDKNINNILPSADFPNSDNKPLLNTNKLNTKKEKK